MSNRYFLSQDNDCHWYIIPVARQQEWDEWRNISEDSERAWEAPAFAVPLGGGPRSVTFTAPMFS